MGSISEEISYTREPIAIVGSSCRLPGGASSPSKLWDLLKDPRDVVQEIPLSRFNIKAFHHTDSQHHGVRQLLLKLDQNSLVRKQGHVTNPRSAECQRTTCLPS
jgi:hypothetical protein